MRNRDTDQPPPSDMSPASGQQVGRNTPRTAGSADESQGEFDSGDLVENQPSTKPVEDPDSQ